MLQRPGERLPWQPAAQVNAQPHDEPTIEIQRKNYFGPSRFYCVETICASCGGLYCEPRVPCSTK